MQNKDIYANINFDDVYLQNKKNEQNDFNIQSLLPMLLSGKNINDILPKMFNTNPLISSLLSSTTSKKSNTTTKKIESDIIDVHSLNKVN